MQAVTVAEVADELYSLTPAEFTAARDERARQLRAAGQRDVAAAVKKLARPTASAWLVNQLARRLPEQMTRLSEVGEALQDAQRTLSGDRLRELSGQRRLAIGELLPAAAEIAKQAGLPASTAVLDEVRATLEAALADAGARDAVQSGRLTRALSYAGLGEVDLSAALALAAKPRPAARSGHAARGRQADQADAERELHEADRAAAAAEAILDKAERELAGLGQQRQFLQRRIEHLERELGEARAEDARLARDGKQAGRSRDAAARELEAANRRLAQARQQGSGAG